jgi:hypothetical protein
VICVTAQAARRLASLVARDRWEGQGSGLDDGSGGGVAGVEEVVRELVGSIKDWQVSLLASQGVGLLVGMELGPAGGSVCCACGVCGVCVCACGVCVCVCVWPCVYDRVRVWVCMQDMVRKTAEWEVGTAR